MLSLINDDDAVGEGPRLTPAESSVTDLYEVLPRPDFVTVLSPSHDADQPSTIAYDHPDMDHHTHDAPAALDYGTADLSIIQPDSTEEVGSPVPPTTVEEPPSAVLEASQEHADAVPPADVLPEVVYDSDPPFRTDGRGRVVWSSATAAGRGRRGCTSSHMAGAAPTNHHDKPAGEMAAGGRS